MIDPPTPRDVAWTLAVVFAVSAGLVACVVRVWSRSWRRSAAWSFGVCGGLLGWYGYLAEDSLSQIPAHIWVGSLFELEASTGRFVLGAATLVWVPAVLALAVGSVRRIWVGKPRPDAATDRAAGHGRVVSVVLALVIGAVAALVVWRA